jgi:replicative DNA helicase
MAEIKPLLNRILRSFCANSPAEQDEALENYSTLNISVLKISGLHKKLIDEITRFHTALGGPPSTQTLSERFALLREIDTSLLAEEIGVETPSWGANFHSLVEDYLEALNSGRFRDVLAETSQIIADGLKVGNEELRGLRGAMEYVVRKAVDLQQENDPYQETMDNSSAVLFLRNDFLERVDQPTLAYGMATNFTPLDEATRGGQPGELWIIGGFVSHGKSTLGINWMRHLAVEGGFNILIYSLEMKKDQVWKILATSHSAHPKWGGRPALEYDKIKSGTLSREDKGWYLNEVLPDLENPDYGRIEVIQPSSSKTTLEDIRARAEVVNRRNPLDVLFVDYLQLVSTDKGKGQDKRQLVNDNIAAAKQMALNFDRGNSILVVSPHQINRAGVQEAQKNGGVYDLSALADNNEAERSADCVITVYQDAPLRQKDEAVVCHLKSRDSHRVDPFNIYAPSRHRFMGDLATPGTSGVPLDALLNS